jgi:hypothetical protein
MDLQTRFLRLEELLQDHQALWQAQPFKQPRPPWCEEYPALASALLALDDQQLARLGGDHGALLTLLQGYLPGLAPLDTLCALPELPTRQHLTTDARFSAHIPGRKWQQITAFARRIDRPGVPLLEWCGGKGHLGRLLAQVHGQPVLTLEHDPGLCEQGEALAQRSAVPQRFILADVLQPETNRHLPGRHAVALHACGELHRRLIATAVSQGVVAMDIAPCCYHHLLAGDYRPLSACGKLVLTRDDLRLAVTGAATAATRELRLRDQEMAWKLAYLQLLGLQGEEEYRPLKPIDKAWLGLDFEGFCRAMAQREGDELTPGHDWQRLEQSGWQRQRETMRLSLLRQVFSRAIELWLVLDLALYLEQAGYRVELGTFCGRELSPRNLLLSARLLD